MQLLYNRCCGMDIHKASITVCVLIQRQGHEPEYRKRTFESFTDDLVRLRRWLAQCKVTHLAMESTGVYWKPVWNVLEEGPWEMLLINPQHFHGIPGEKTDPKDSRWIAELLAHGLLRPSFVPPQAIRQLRDLTRYRVHLKQDRNRIHNRIHKQLEDANIKLDCVASDILGMSGRAMINALIEGRNGPVYIADHAARGHLRKKVPELARALTGRVTEHHRLMLAELVNDLDATDQAIRRIEGTILERMQPYQDVIERLTSIPGVDLITAWALIAEIGTDMSRFGDADHLVSWAGLCPGLNESGGKRRSGRTRKGDRYLKRVLCQTAWAISHSKDNYLAALFYRLAARIGIKKATLAVAHQVLRIVFHIIRDGTVYRELGANYFDRLHPERTTKRLVQRLEQLGHQVSLQPKSDEPASS
jgi:transposase